MNIRQLLEQSHRPFASHARVDRYFPAAAIEDARGRLTRSIERGDGPGLVIGTAGTGKSLLLQALAAQYHGRLDVVLLACAQICTRRALLQAILFELGLPYHQRDEGEVRLALLDQLLSDEQSAEGLLLLVDEAQSLSVALLEELRIMTNLVRGGMPRVRLVLAGGPALEETFAAPELESFSQRLAARCYLSPLGRDETIQYVRAQLAASGAEPDAVFAADAWDAVVEATDGVPRLVNQLCDRALLVADTDERPRVDRQIVQRAWADLQQLPTPWDTPAESAPDEGHEVLEFGSLSDATADVQPPADEPALQESAGLVEDSDDGPSDVPPHEFPADEVTDLSFPLAISVDDIGDGMGDDEPAADTASVGQSSEDDRSAGSSPRVYAAGADDSADPFDEQFDEEEIVLDNFVAWDAVWQEMPHVENLRDPQFAARVQDAMDACAVAADAVAGDDSRSSPAADFPLAKEEDADLEAETADTAADMADDGPAEPVDEGWPPLRLAVVAETPTLQPVPLIRSSGPGVVTAVAAFDPVLPEAEGLDFRDTASAPATAHPAACVAVQADASAPSGDSYGADSVLVVEDDPDDVAPARPTVQRQDYRQFFSRLRGG